MTVHSERNNVLPVQNLARASSVASPSYVIEITLNSIIRRSLPSIQSLSRESPSSLILEIEPSRRDAGMRHSGACNRYGSCRDQHR